METQKETASSEKKLEQAKQVLEMNKSIGLSILGCILAPVLLKDIKDIDPETYYSGKSSLRETSKMLKKASEDIDKELEKMN